MYDRLLRHILLPPALRWRGRPYLSLAARIRRNQFRPAAVTSREQLDRLSSLLRLAIAEVPHYRERYSAIDSKPRSLGELESIPVLSKEDILAGFPDRMTVARKPGWELVGTRGTTDRIMVVHDGARRDVEWATRHVAMTEDSDYDLGKKIVLIPPDECSKICAIEEKREATVSAQLRSMVRERRLLDRASRAELRRLLMESWLRRATILPPFGSGGTHIGEEKLEIYRRRLWEIRPSLLKALPEYLVAIARFATKSGRPLPSTPVVKPMGGKLSEPLKESIEAAFGGSLREDYGSQEFGAIAFDCRLRRGLHVLEDCFVVEVARGGKPVPEGELGVVLVTDLENQAMPLIRYRIGDVGWIDSSPCPCGRTSKRLFLEGRLEDTVVTNDGRALTFEALGTVLYREPGIEDFQLLETPDGWFELAYVASPGRARVEERSLRRIAARELGIETDVRLRLQSVSTLLPEASGKFRHVRSRSFFRFDGAPAQTRGSEVGVRR